MKNNQLTKMQTLVYVIAGLYFLKWSGISSEVSDPSTTGEQMYYETTQNSVNEDFNHSLSKSYLELFRKPKPLVSNPLFEDMPKNVSGEEKISRKRDIPGSGLNHELKMKLLQLHNLYRSNVTPPAGNMVYMEWDDELAALAQNWSDNCNFEHGLPENNYPVHIGQNLYIGMDHTCYHGVYMWFEEYRNYDLRKTYCLPDKQCLHYVTMAWAASNKLGCGQTKCGIKYLLTCHYSPGAVKGPIMYKVAKPCSQCSPEEGTLCLKNLCMTSEQCRNNPFECQFAKCERECLNCGRLDEETCLCKCADGWDSPDCSDLCKNSHARCGMKPGWPTKSSCSLNNGAVGTKFCRKMCETCEPVNITASKDTCCGGKLCEDGFVLDSSCKCNKLCPGPICDSKDADQVPTVQAPTVQFTTIQAPTVQSTTAQATTVQAPTVQTLAVHNPASLLLANSGASYLNQISYFAWWITFYTFYFSIY